MPVPQASVSERSSATITYGHDSSFNPRLAIGSLLSALLPGAGHFVVGRWRKGGLLLGISITVLLLYKVARIPAHVVTLALAAIGMIALCVFSAWDVGYSPRLARQRLSQWWLLLLLPSALAGASISANLGSFLAGVRPYSMISSSMEHTIPEGSRPMVDLHYYRSRSPERGDIIVFEAPNEPGLIVIKRVIAIGGDTIDIEKEKVSVNDQTIEEPYVFIEGPPPELYQTRLRLQVPPGKLFVMGDKRHQSLDSRFEKYGVVDVSTVRGKVIYVLSGLKISRDWIAMHSE